MKLNFKTCLFLSFALFAGMVSATTVSFNALGGTAPDPASIVVTNGMAYGALATTTRAGYTFADWWTLVDGIETKVTAETEVLTADNHTLYAKWTTHIYKVTFDAQGGTASDPIQSYVTYDGAYGALAVTTRDGYTLDGWWTGTNGTGTKVIPETVVRTVGNHSLYAKWTAQSYTVTFNAQGGIAPTPATDDVVYDAAYGDLATTTRAGYTFGGWWTGVGGTGTEITAETVVKTLGNHSLYAKWTVKNYTVIFDAQGGIAPVPATAGVIYDAAYGNLATTTRAGYTFGGWWTGANGSGTEITNATVVATAANHTLYAKWTANSYTVTFSAQGGTAPEPATTSVTYDVAYGTLPTTTRDYYTFGGWWTGANGSGTEVTAATLVSVTQHHTLYAKWTGNSYTVSFDAQGGSELDPMSKTVTYGKGYGTLATTTRAGYRLAGWWMEVGGGEMEVTAATVLSRAEHHTLYARWTAIMYTVSFDAQGGVAPNPVSKKVTYDAVYGALATTTRVGYTFEGWWTEIGGTGTEVTAAEFVKTVGAHTLYAKWTGNSYLVTFDAVGGTDPDPTTNTVIFGSAYGALPVPTRDYYTFGGWWTEAGGTGTEVTAATEVTTAGAHTLYPKWTGNSYLVAFDARGGSDPEPATNSIAYGDVYGELPATILTGYTFEGWWLVEDGSATQITNASVMTTAEDHTLYAQWTTNSYTVTFDAEGGTDPDLATINVVYDTAYGTLATTTRTGYAFSGWWTGPNGSGTEVSSELMMTVAADHILYASWTSLLLPVHHFWSDQLGGHFYIMGDSERDRITAKYKGIWRYENLVWYAYPTQVEGTQPVHRFWSDKLSKHFYIMGDSERDRIIAKFQGIWRYEAIAWYAYPTQVEDSEPVGRFWSDRFMGHFYTITQSEIDRVADKYPGVWNYEAVAYYAFTSLPDGGLNRSFTSDRAMGSASNEIEELQVESEMDGDVGLLANEESVIAFDVVYPLAYSDCQVDVQVYDTVTEQWARVLDVTDSGSTAVLKSVNPDQSYFLEVFASEASEGECVSVHRSWFEMQLDPPETLNEEESSFPVFDGVGMPVVRLRAPVTEGTQTVKLYSASEGVVQTLEAVSSADIIELELPEWNRWYWISGWQDADNGLIMSFWVRIEAEE